MCLQHRPFPLAGGDLSPLTEPAEGTLSVDTSLGDVVDGRWLLRSADGELGTPGY